VTAERAHPRVGQAIAQRRIVGFTIDEVGEGETRERGESGIHRREEFAGIEGGCGQGAIRGPGLNAVRDGLALAVLFDFDVDGHLHCPSGLGVPESLRGGSGPDVEVLVVARSRDDRNGAVHPGRSGEPLTPFRIVFRAIDEVARMKREGRAWRLAKCFPEHARPVGADVVLGIAEIDKGERRRLGPRGAEVKPFAPIHAIPHPVGVQGVGGQLTEVDRVIVNRTELRLMPDGRGYVFGGGGLRLFAGEAKLGQTPGHVRRRAPGHRLARGGIARPGQDHAVRYRRGPVQIRRGHRFDGIRMLVVADEPARSHGDEGEHEQAGAEAGTVHGRTVS
jgi:hypothetical protein